MKIIKIRMKISSSFIGIYRVFGSYFIKPRPVKLASSLSY